MADEAILFRIKKLLNLAQSPNENEAAQAAAKAQALLAQHNLELADVENLDPTKREAVDQFDWTSLVYPNNKVLGWREDLWNTVTRVMWCKAYKSSTFGTHYYDTIGRLRWKRGRIAWTVGRKTDNEIAEYLFVYLARELQRLADEYAWQHGRRAVHGSINRTRQSFLKGAVSIVVDRLLHEWREGQNKNDHMHALVVARDAEVNNWLDQYVGKLQVGKQYRRSVNITDYVAGQSAGREIDLLRGIERGGDAPRLEGG